MNREHLTIFIKINTSFRRSSTVRIGCQRLDVRCSNFILVNTRLWSLCQYLVQFTVLSLCVNTVGSERCSGFDMFCVVPVLIKICMSEFYLFVVSYIPFFFFLSFLLCLCLSLSYTHTRGQISHHSCTNRRMLS